MHIRIIQTALDRGTKAVGEIIKAADTHYVSSKCTTPQKNDVAVYYQNISSSEASSDRISNHNTKQVGGISGSKLPLLTLEPHFIMKPLRSNRSIITCAKDGIHDKTKIYRGVREVAFYEYIQFASSLQSSDCMMTQLASLIHGNGYPFNTYSLPRLLSLFDTPNSGLFSLSSNKPNQDDTCQVLNVLCLLAAHQVGDQATIKTLQSCVLSWYYRAKELLDLIRIAEFAASYAGIVDVENPLHEKTSAPMQQQYLILRDITATFRHPNIIDIKMGTQTYEPDAPYSKKLREIRKYPLQSNFGFRIVGMRVYDSATDEYRYWGKQFGTQLLCRNDVKRALKLFFQCEDGTQQAETANNVLSCVVSKLAKIKSCMSYNTTMAFYASSILISYEGFPDSYLGSSVPDPAVTMIDFTHVCHKAGGDYGYIKGAGNLLGILSEVIFELNLQSN